MERQDKRDTSTLESGQKVTILLPFYLHSGFAASFKLYGFKVIWSERKVELENLIETSEIDLAIEWQHGPRDFPLLDLLIKHKKKVPIFLALNWNSSVSVSPWYKELGYTDILSVPWDESELAQKFHDALPPEKKGIYECTVLWALRGKHIN